MIMISMAWIDGNMRKEKRKRFVRMKGKNDADVVWGRACEVINNGMDRGGGAGAKVRACVRYV